MVIISRISDNGCISGGVMGRRRKHIRIGFSGGGFEDDEAEKQAGQFLLGSV